MSETRIHANPNDVIVDYLKDIRDQLAALNKKLDKLTVESDQCGPLLRVGDFLGG